MLRRRILLLTAGLLSLGLVAAVLIGWAVRFRAAGRLIDKRLAAAGTPSSYRLTQLDPTGAEIEQLELGDPARPDLMVGHLHVRFGYGWHGPYVAGVSADGVHLNAQLDRRGLSLGALDRLIPKGGTGPALPDLSLHLSKVWVRLQTPSGPTQIRIDGSGNPQRRFRGRVAVAAPSLKAGDCKLGAIRGSFQAEVLAGAPHLAGPIALGGIFCPARDLGAGRLIATINADPHLQTFFIQTRLSGFGGKAGPFRFAGINGTVQASGGAGRYRAVAHIALAGLGAPDLARRVAGLAPSLATTPLGPVVQQATTAAAQLLTRTDAEVAIIGELNGSDLSVSIRQLTATDPQGAWVRVTPRAGLEWDPNGWRVDGDLRSGGGALPQVAAVIRQTAAAGPIVGTLRIAPYSAGSAQMALAPTSFQWADGRLQFTSRATVSGPLPNGFLRNLTLPLDGQVAAGGAFRLGQGCRRVTLDAARIGSIRLGATGLSFCGTPLLTRGDDGRLAIDASTGPLHVLARIGDTPATLTASTLHLNAQGFEASQLATALGRGPFPTRLAVEHLSGGWSGGSFAGAGGTIGSVPLRLSDAQGQWSLTGGTLHLTGALRVSDMASEPRFRTLAVRNVDLLLSDGTIAATGRLVELAHGGSVAGVRLHHDLSNGTGEAVLTADAIRFQPKGLQPDDLTPLTLGVIANVAGVVSGNGVVDWTPAGTSSRGEFGTDRLDLAAAFGPVTGLSGRVHFTDLLGLVSAPDQQARVAEINPGVAIDDGRIRFHLPGQDRVAVDGASWPFAGGTLQLEPTTLDLGNGTERHLTFTITGLDAAKFVQQLDFPNIAATGTFDGTLPMSFNTDGGRIVNGAIVARPPGGTLAYVGELSSARLGTMGKLAFDALKAIQYSTLKISLDGKLDGEMVSLVSFTGVRQATPEQGLAARLIRNLPFRFNIRVRAPFRGLVGSARSYADPRLLLAAPPSAPVQPTASGPVR